MDKIQEKEWTWKDPKAELIKRIYAHLDPSDINSPPEPLLRRVRSIVESVYEKFVSDISTPTPIWDSARKEFHLRWGGSEEYAQISLEQGASTVWIRLKTVIRGSYRSDDFNGSYPDHFVSAIRTCESNTRKSPLKKSPFKPRKVKVLSSWNWTPSAWAKVKSVPKDRIGDVQTVLRLDYDAKTILGQSRLRMLKGATAKVQGSSAKTNDLCGIETLYVRIGGFVLVFPIYKVIKRKNWPDGRVQRTEHQPLGNALLVATLGVQRFYYQHGLKTPDWSLKTIKIHGSVAVLDGIIKA